jgi:ZIP family zinc transporter
MWRPIGPRLLGLVMVFGSGVLISAVAFELVQEAFDTSSWHGGVAMGLLAGSVVFFAGDWLIDRSGGSGRKGLRRRTGGLSALAGYALLDGASPNTIAFVLSFAAGAILTILADTMMPEAFEQEGKLVGVVRTSASRWHSRSAL